MKIINFILDFLYGLFGIRRTVEDAINKANALSTTSEYLNKKDDIETTESVVSNISSEGISKTDQTISFS